MTDRLVLGSGSLVTHIVESLRDRPGTVRVGTDDDDLASVLREEGIDVETMDPTNQGTLAEFDVDVVFVLEETESANLGAARAARAALPDAYLLAYTGENSVGQGGSLTDIVDKVVDPGEMLTAHILDRVGDASRQLRELWGVLRDIDRLAVVAHDNPDPDAIASGVALAQLAMAADCDADVCYYGSINHQENRAFVNVLGLELRNIEGDEFSEYDGIALVDHSRPGVNDQLPPDAAVDIVIDHHPPRAPVDARFVDLRSAVGATSTLLVDYLDRVGVELTEDVATALLFGIHVDTDGFSREVSSRDFEAAAVLVEVADFGTLERIESPSISPQTLEIVARSIQNRRVEGEVLLSCVGRIGDRDALAQAADRLLDLEGVTSTMVYGVRDGTIYISARSRGSAVDIGETLRAAFNQIGSAGGHVDMAGAQITLGLLEAVDDRDESLREIVEDVVANRFLEAVSTDAGPQVTGVHASEVEVTDRYLDPAGESKDDAPTSEE